MAKATPCQWEMAIRNFRRTAHNFRKTAAYWPEGDWRRAADLRIAERADERADALEARYLLVSA